MDLAPNAAGLIRRGRLLEAVTLGEIERHSRHLSSCYLGHGASSAEMRAASAVDIALWDLLGQAVGQPIHVMLGGLARPSIAVYNTCAGANYNRLYDRRVVRPGERATSNAPMEDQVAFMTAADELAASLIEEGMTGMKIWPFDPWALENNGAYITAAGLKAGMEPFEKIRRAVGDRIEIMAELHSLWQVPAARRIAQALESVDAFWVEDPVAKMDNVSAVAEIASATRLPISGGETLAGRAIFRDLLSANALAVAIVDLGWCGGFTEARKIASLADTYAKPIAPHDCSGPVVFTASVHLSLHAPNAIFQEMVRAFLRGWYQDVLTELPRVDGRARLSDDRSRTRHKAPIRLLPARRPHSPPHRCALRERHENHQDRDATARRVSEPALGACPHR